MNFFQVETLKHSSVLSFVYILFCIEFFQVETHKNGSILSFVYVLFFIEISGTFQWKSVHFWCKQEKILSRVCRFQLFRKRKLFITWLIFQKWMHFSTEIILKRKNFQKCRHFYYCYMVWPRHRSLLPGLERIRA